MFCLLLGDSPSQWDLKAEVMAGYDMLSQCHVGMTKYYFNNPNDACFCVETKNIRK